MGRVPGGGLGCLLGFALLIFGGYYAIKGLYYVLYWAAPALVVLTLIINWRVIPDTLRNWLKTLETNPVFGLVMAAFAVLAFPFFTLWLFLKALGYRKLEKMKREFERAEPPRDEFVDFEEIESTPLGKAAEPEILEAPEKQEKPKAKKEENPYDGFFG
jgi:hypothetical protein